MLSREKYRQEAVTRDATKQITYQSVDGSKFKVAQDTELCFKSYIIRVNPYGAVTNRHSPSPFCISIHSAYFVCYSYALYDLCAHTSLMDELRDKAIKEIGTNGWTHSSLLRLRKMDSFLKESGRSNAISIVSFQRLVLALIRLSNGFTIPAGTQI